MHWASDKVSGIANSVGNILDRISGGSGSPGDPNNWNHRDYYLEQAQNRQLRNAISEMYRRGSSIGDGGTADILRYEYDMGQSLRHLQKAQDMIKNLNSILTNQSLSEAERRLTYQLLGDLHDAVKYVR